MANNLSFPNGFENQPVQFSVGTSEAYDGLVSNDLVDSNRFYVIQQGTQYLLYLGEKPIAQASPVYDSALSLTSDNAVKNRVITQGLNNAIEVIKDENIETYEGGKFYYKADNINPSLKFYISSLESIDLLKSAASVISTYSPTDETNAISGKGVAAALDTLKLIDLEELPEALEKGAFYRIYNKENETYTLWFVTAQGVKINLSEQIPMDHSDTDSKYGASTDSKYGHAKSGIPITDDSATTLSFAYTSSDKDKDLIGSNIESYARVDHKHPYPNFTQVVNTVNEDEKKTIAEKLLGSSDVYSFIQEGEKSYKQLNEKIIPANERLFTLEEDYISSTSTNNQTIASKLTINENLVINSSNALIVKTIESPKTTEENYEGLTFNGPVIATKGLQIADDGLAITSGNITANSSTINASNIVLTGALEVAGNSSLGPNGSGLKITNPIGDEAGVVTSNYDWVFTGAINANTIEATSINATSVNAALEGDITSDSASFTGAVTSKAYTIKEEDEAYKWNTLLALNLGNSNYSLNTNGSANLNNIVANSISTNNFTFNSISLTSELGNWNDSEVSNKNRLVYDDINVLTEQDLLDSNGLIHTWLNANYIANTSIKAELSNSNSNIPTSAAVYHYINSMITVSSTQPTGLRVGQLWINTSLGNGVLHYWTGSAWQAVSGVWS